MGFGFGFRLRPGSGFGWGWDARLLHLHGLLDDAVDVLDHLHLGRGRGRMKG